MSEIKHIGGLKELQLLLDQLPAKVEKNIMTGALRAGAKLILMTARANVPVATPNQRNQMLYGGYAGALRDSLRLSSQFRNGQVVVSIKAGGKTKRGGDAYYARFVEYGTSSHRIRAKAGGKLFFGGKFHTEIMHPGAKPKPFMRPALDENGFSAMIAAAEYIKKRLATKEGLDTSAIEIDL